ncbi:MAG: hypothetical protein QY332_10115 [Anaerolineales bacterium]|nr:MAG: hypothetical protein QY332_10115 [Anaerolineales bacterium]
MKTSFILLNDDKQSDLIDLDPAASATQKLRLGTEKLRVSSNKNVVTSAQCMGKNTTSTASRARWYGALSNPPRLAFR